MRVIYIVTKTVYRKHSDPQKVPHYCHKHVSARLVFERRCFAIIYFYSKGEYIVTVCLQ